MKPIAKLTTALLLIVLAGCGKGEDKEHQTTSPSPVLQPQLETLEKAREVNNIVLDQAEQQRERIEEQSK